MKRLFRAVFSLFTLSVLFAGCGSHITVQAAPSGENHIEVSVDLGDALYDAIRDAYAGARAFADSGAGSAAQVAGDFKVFDTAGIRQSLEDRGFTNVSAASDEPTALAVSADGAAEDFITVASSSVDVRLSPGNIRRLVSTLPEETRYFLDLLMAPVLTGEGLGETDYREVLAAVYGEDLAREAENAVVNLTLEAPNGAEKAFEIPLLSLLTLKDEAVYSLGY